MKYLLSILLMSNMSLAMSTFNNWKPYTDYTSSQKITKFQFQKETREVEFSISGVTKTSKKVFLKTKFKVDESTITKDIPYFIGIMKVEGISDPISLVYNLKDKSFKPVSPVPAGKNFTASIRFIYKN